MNRVELISTPSRDEFFERFASRGAPVIIVDATEGWRCHPLWTDDYFVAKLRGRRFLVNRSLDGAFGIFSSRMRDTDTCRLVTINEFLRLFVSDASGGEIHYMQQKTIQETFPELVQDLDYVTFLERAR